MENSETKMELVPTGAELDREVIDWWAGSLAARSGGRGIVVMSRLHQPDLPGFVEPVTNQLDGLDLPTHHHPRNLLQ